MKDDFSGINIVPLVDIMLVLITIVLVTANFMVRGMIPVNLPKASAEASTVKESVVLDITPEGAVYYLGEAVLLEDLPGKLAEVSVDNPILLNADKDLTMQPFVSVVEVLKNNGYSKISIQTER